MKNTGVILEGNVLAQCGIAFTRAVAGCFLACRKTITQVASYSVNGRVRASGKVPLVVGYIVVPVELIDHDTSNREWLPYRILRVPKFGNTE